jgi:SOS response associated peptidase (SRAP)
MCGRFVQRYTWDDIQDLCDLPDGPPRNLPAHYNIAPTDLVEVVRPAAGGAPELVSMRWGLVPWWWKKPLKQLPATSTQERRPLPTNPYSGMRQPPSLHHLGQRLLRVAQKAGRQAAVFHQRRGRWRAEFRRPVGLLEEP